MYATERQQLIEHLVSTDGRVAVVDLARRFGVTTETVRRDLDQLETAGIVRRVHGGAVARTRVSTVETSFVERTQRRSDAKRAIAERALEAIGADGDGSIYIDAGTTTAAVAGLLAQRPVTGHPLEVVTHSMTVAHLLAGAPGLNLTAIGGRVRGLTAAAVGAQTVDAISRLRPDLAFIGTNGLSATFGLSTPDPDEAAVKRAIIASARRIVVLADAEKFDGELLVSFGRLADLDILVTDAPPPADLVAALDDADVEVWTA
ncbi:MULTISPECIES: DeoR/GlpR family DNA-binding transcription regulator [Microbacterium]|uniref:DeoR/GlpR family DNA-binding transcription regulator n=1 Tax=Microbacterium TaxID=33882 RepID=UPI00077CBD60|nr:MULTISPECIES: DeoR/GlpR family DNA-binding transcription regulator [Microbacterium]QOC25336.1 DeoR/GlpR transcriptional regulator [Microbacterium hominis]QOC29353.1 DeoR/GlpR transcriptional regulator [Microbacterium hominis]QYF98365.1 DeoR/GlpR family DNA-binding transcription regulator [Microbacterium sp. PAMC21962]